MNEQQIEKMKQIGSEWENYGKHRIYFNNLPERYGLDVSYYNTGNVAGATLDGEKISNTQARKLLAKMNSVKIYYDLDSMVFTKSDYYNDMDFEMFEIIVNSIKEEIGA